MSLLIVTNSPMLSQKVHQILRHYFGSSKNPSILNIKTKYYICDVPIQVCSPSDLLILETQDKVDLLLFIFDYEQLVEDMQSLIDGGISKFSPESQIVLVNSVQDIQEDWKYQETLMNCDNFVSVVYENIEKVQNIKPDWKEGGLLSQNQEQFEIFSLFQLIQTTVWTNSLKTQNQTKVPSIFNKEQQTQEKKISQHPVQKQQIQNEKQNPQKKQRNMMEEECNFEQDEQNLENQMMEFELLMQQMMSMKDTSLKGNQRKMKAQELIMKLTGNMNF